MKKQVEKKTTSCEKCEKSANTKRLLFIKGETKNIDLCGNCATEWDNTDYFTKI